MKEEDTEESKEEGENKSFIGALIAKLHFQKQRRL
jgi:hypothetical protein